MDETSEGRREALAVDGGTATGAVPRGPGSEVRAVREEERAAAERLLHLVFRDDPLSRWIFPGEEHREERHPRLFATFLGMSMKHGVAERAADGRGVACWFHSRAGELVGGAEFDEAVGAVDPDNPRLAAFGAASETVHPHEDHAYLQAIAVHPREQGSGLGSRLLWAMLQRCDAEGLPAYLEASNSDSRRFYLRHGFADTLTEPLRPQPDGPPIWPMWREPRGS